MSMLSVSPNSVLTVASWLVYSLFSSYNRCNGTPISLSITHSLSLDVCLASAAYLKHCHLQVMRHSCTCNELITAQWCAYRQRVTFHFFHNQSQWSGHTVSARSLTVRATTVRTAQQERQFIPWALSSAFPGAIPGERNCKVRMRRSKTLWYVLIT